MFNKLIIHEGEQCSSSLNLFVELMALVNLKFAQNMLKCNKRDKCQQIVMSIFNLLNLSKSHNFHLKCRVLYEAHMFLASTNISEKFVQYKNDNDVNQQVSLMNSIIDISSHISKEDLLVIENNKLTTPPSTPTFK